MHQYYTHPAISSVLVVIINTLTRHSSEKAKHSNSRKREAFIKQNLNFTIKFSNFTIINGLEKDLDNALRSHE